MTWQLVQGGSRKAAAHHLPRSGDITDGPADGRVLVHLGPRRAPRLKCLSPAARRRGVFALIYTTEPSDTVEVIEITPAFSDKLINARLN